MATLGTEKTITKEVWTLIIDNKTNARVYQKTARTGGYLTIAYDDPADNPNTLLVDINPESAAVEKMFFNDNNDWFFQHSASGYVWAAPYGDKDGKLVVTS